jgi:hypothetical protein
MTHVRIAAGMFTLAMAIAAGAAAQSLPRSANGGGDAAGKNPPVQVPRYPYAGAWEGSLTLDGGAAKTGTPIAMKFTVADGAKQSYDGETTIEGRAAAKHLNISAAAAAEAPGQTGQVLRRSAGTSPTAALAAGSAPEMDTLAAGDRALLLYHTPTRSMLLCDDGHRCVALATLTWEEQGADGRKYAYSAQLAAADTLTGTVTVTHGSAATQTGTFTLTRRK